MTDVIEHTVTWTMQVDAASPKEAAEMALARIKAPGAWCHVFEVITFDPNYPQEYFQEAVDLNLPAIEYAESGTPISL